LRRRLARDGLTYTELVEQARFQAATRLLEDTEAKITDIAFELGYGDPSNFTHAFHRWAGVSPRNYRRQRLAH
jgi:AraC-like DNA-binding protein